MEETSPLYIDLLLPTVLAGKVMQWVMSVHLYPLHLLNKLTVDLDHLHVYGL